VVIDAGREDVVALVERSVDGGVDLALEASGSPAALEEAIAIAGPRGSVVLGGNQPPDASLPMPIVERLMRKELTVTGCFMSYSAPWPGHEWTESLAAAASGDLDMGAMISLRAPLAHAPAIFGEVAAHRLAHRKIVFDPTG
jgi:L-iditol 2-dehydrogenase